MNTCNAIGYYFLIIYQHGYATNQLLMLISKKNKLRDWCTYSQHLIFFLIHELAQ